MTDKRMIRRAAALLLALTVLLSSAAAEIVFGWSVFDGGIELPGGSVRYPVLSTALPGLEQRMTEEIGLYGLFDRLALLPEGSKPLRVSYTVSDSALAGGLFSCVFEVSGPITSARVTHEWRTLNHDLDNDMPFMLDDLFTDASAGRERILSILEESVLWTLSPMLENSDLLTLPDGLGVDSTALMLYYPADSYRTLNGEAGCVRIRWSELADLLDADMARRIGIRTDTVPDAAAVAEAVAAGSLPGIPVEVGSSMQAAADRWHEAEDPDLCTDGLMLLPDCGIFRETWLLCDAPNGDYTNSTVRAIRSDCLDLYGLVTGVTDANTWRTALGEPGHTVRVSIDAAEANRTQSGFADYYNYGDHILRLNADEDGVLCSITLME